MEKFTVSFFGHRTINDVFKIEYILEEYIKKIIYEREYVEFLVGRDGEFDLLVASTIRRCRKTTRDDNSALIWVLPYKTKNFEVNIENYLNYYDELEICDLSAESYFKAAYKIRNCFMIDRSDLIIFGIEHEYGGAYSAMKYAKKRNKNIINLFDVQKLEKYNY